MKTILFVCTGNICRSPMAEELFRVETSGTRDYVAISAGTSAVDGMPPSENAILAMRELGRDISAHRSTLLNESLVKKADLIFTMARSHLITVYKNFPDASEKVFTLRQGADIPDPWGGSLPVYQHCRDEIQTAIRAVITELENFFNK